MNPPQPLLLPAEAEAESEPRRRPDGNQEYQDYLQSQRWRTLRTAAMLRAKGRCEICRRARGREAAHLTYDRVFYEPLDDVLWLCRRCHLELDQTARNGG